LAATAGCALGNILQSSPNLLAGFRSRAPGKGRRFGIREGIAGWVDKGGREAGREDESEGRDIQPATRTFRPPSVHSTA